MCTVYTRLVLGLGLSLLPLAATFAQASVAPPTASAPLVQVEVSFVAASTVDVDNLDMKFNRIPFPMPAAKPPPGGTFLQVLSGGLVPQFYQTLVRTRGKVVQAPTLITINNVPYTLRINTSIPYHNPIITASPFGETDAERAQHTRLLPVRISLAITPRINGDGSITLNLAPEISDVSATATGPHAGILETVPSGEMLVIAGLPINGEKLAGDPELLIFVTPTIVGTDTQKTNVGQSALLAPPALGTPDATKRIFLEVSSADLQAVVAMLRQQTGMKASVLGAAGAYKPVTLHTGDVTLMQALQALAASAGAQVSRNAAGVYVFSPLPGTVVTPMPQVPVGDGSTVTVTP